MSFTDYKYNINVLKYHFRLVEKHEVWEFPAFLQPCAMSAGTAGPLIRRSFQNLTLRYTSVSKSNGSRDSHLFLMPCMRRRKEQMELCLALDRRNSAYLLENSMSPSCLRRSRPADNSCLKHSQSNDQINTDHYQTNIIGIRMFLSHVFSPNYD